MIVDVSTFLPAPPEKVETCLKTSRLLFYVVHPLVKFIPSGDTQIPENWDEGTYWVSLRVLGFIPFGKQALVISFPESQNYFSMRDNGHSAMVKKWDHRMTIDSMGTGTLYRDHVTIEAGVFTFFVWAFAQLFYRHRQRRWRQLITNAFNYEAT